MNLMNGWSKAKEFWQEDTTYTFYVVANNGKGMTQKTFSTSFFRKLTVGAVAFLAVGIASFGAMQYTAYQNFQQLQALEDFQRTRAAQEKKLQELTKLTETVQKDMASLAKTEAEVRMQMQKAGMHVPKQSTDLVKYGGKGGNGDISSIASRMEIINAQNKNIHALLEAQNKDWAAYLKAIEEENYRRSARPNHWPLAGGTVTSRFGGRRDPITGGRKNHAGIDVGASWGTPVYAAGSGYVNYAGWYFGYGNYIKLNHECGYQTAYGHLSSIAVEEGAYVKKGQLIGRVGSTGYSTGPHLHFEVLQDGKQINPMDMF